MFYVPIKLTRTCERCAMNYARKLPACPHCSDFSDAELRDFQQRRNEELEGIAGLGKVFIVIGILLFLFSIAAWNS